MDMLLFCILDLYLLHRHFKSERTQIGYSPVKVTLAQLNPIVGDIAGNAARVLAATHEAREHQSQLMIASELIISGYPPKDLLLRDGFVTACDQAVEQLAKEIPADMAVLVGHPTQRYLPAGRIANAASLLHRGAIVATVQKMLLPNYDVFDERRYFRSAEHVQPIPFQGRQLGVHICEDAWWNEPETTYRNDPVAHPDPITELALAGADVFINLSASPFECNKPDRRFGILKRHVDQHHLPFVFVNQVGGNDDLVFDGNSVVLDQDGQRVIQLPGFSEACRSLDLSDLPMPIPPVKTLNEQLLLDALILGLRDYMQKCGFTDCVLGLSGGIDSALACYIASQAMGKDHVHGLLMPSRYSSEHSVTDARLLAENLGIDYEIIPIDAVHQAYESLDVIGRDLLSEPGSLADQNLQARIRGAIVMTRSNRHGWIALATGNKSELAVGYCTLYGDMAGGFAVLADVYKRDVYQMSRYINMVREGDEIIPENVINKAPSAELAPGQFDQDSLPPYDILDVILVKLIEEETSVAKLYNEFPPETVRWVAQKLDRNEFKRRQMPPGIKLSRRAFGSGRRMPMAARFNLE